MNKPLFRIVFKSVLAAIAVSLVTAGQARAAVKTEVVHYKQGGTDLQGYLAYDDAATDKRPGIVVVPEWWGLTQHPKTRAERLAGLGYVALAVDMYGNGQTTSDPKVAGKLAGALRGDRDLLRARVAAGMDFLKKNEHVDPGKIAAMGFCFGGTTALELARSGADIRGTVAFHAGLDTPHPEDAKNIKGKILALQGADDPMVGAEQRSAFEKEMRDAKVDWQLVLYGGAVHAFTNPDADKFNIPGIAYNAEADQRSWEAMKAFFAEIFK